MMSHQPIAAEKFRELILFKLKELLTWCQGSELAFQEPAGGELVRWGVGVVWWWSSQIIDLDNIVSSKSL